MNKKKLLVTIVLLLAVTAVWVCFNPPRRFGWCRYALTTYSGIPRPISDIQIRADGAVRKIAKTHELSFGAVKWLLEQKPEILIIAIGWDGVVRPDEQIQAFKECEVHILKNREAIRLFNKLRKSGKRIAIHLHSTC